MDLYPIYIFRILCILRTKETATVITITITTINNNENSKAKETNYKSWQYIEAGKWTDLGDEQNIGLCYQTGTRNFWNQVNDIKAYSCDILLSFFQSMPLIIIAHFICKIYNIVTSFGKRSKLHFFMKIVCL